MQFPSKTIRRPLGDHRKVDENLEMVPRIREGECPGVGPREKVDSEELIHELMLELEKRNYIEGGAL